MVFFGRWFLADGLGRWQIGFLSGVFKYYICSPPTKKKGNFHVANLRVDLAHPSVTSDTRGN
jgi:hypothetical protein